MTPRDAGFLAGLALLAGCGWLTAQEPKPAATPVPVTPPPKPEPAVPSLLGKITFKPVGRGVPAGRVDAASRGDGDELASLYVLAPEELGLTTKAQPTLYWFQTRPADVPFEFALLRKNQPQPVLRIAFKDGRRAGFQQVSLAAHGVSLEAGVEYQWVIALIRDPARRSRDIVSSAWMQRVPALPMARPTAGDYAARGIWYDALEGLSAKIAARPDDRHLRAIRDDLLGQVGLARVVEAKVSR